MKKKKQNKILMSAIILAVALICSVLNFDLSDYLGYNLNTGNIKTISSTSSDKETVEFVKCVDGDTATFKINGKKKKVRFIGIDTPESVHPYKEVEEYGKSASEYTCYLLKTAENISLSYENNLSKTDKYGRILAWVWADDELVQEKLISVGYAEVKYIYSNNSKLDLLYKAEKKAQDEKIGIWTDYQEPISNKKTYKVTFKVGNKEEIVEVKGGSVVPLIDNPIKSGYVFAGWTYGGELYDLSKPITRNITLKASFSKN
ncbi:MAG: thermonuclease family protein [Bacilli bacterium]|nr:thermonuclease family protein [Bacilli bacterium]